MIIYEFSTWGAYNGTMYSVREIEVEEKTKTYMGKGCRINKDEIDTLGTSFGNRMYRLDKDPKPYIAAMVARLARRVEAVEAKVKYEKEELAKWEALAERSEE